MWAYFVHSLAPEMGDGTDVVATCDYGGPVVAAVARDNVWAAQFHPEKSSTSGPAHPGQLRGRGRGRGAEAG